MGFVLKPAETVKPGQCVLHPATGKLHRVLRIEHFSDGLGDRVRATVEHESVAGAVRGLVLGGRYEFVPVFSGPLHVAEEER